MRKSAVIALFILLSLSLFSQTRVSPLYVPNKTTAFGQIMPANTSFVFENDSTTTYQLTAQFSASQTMNDVFLSGAYTADQKWVSSIPPAKSSIVQWLDGTRIGNTFIDRSGNGYNVSIINNDIALKSGFPFKSNALIAQLAANWHKVPDTNNFWFSPAGVPNQIPVTALYQNVDYDNLIFCRHVGQQLSPLGQELREPYITDIVTYAQPIKGNQLSKAVKYFGVPVYNTRSTWLDFDNGSDVSGDGSKANPYATWTQAETMCSNGDTVYLKTGIDAEGYIQTSKAITWIGVGNVTVKTEATSNGVIRITGSGAKSFQNLTLDGQSVNSGVGYYSTAQNATFTFCHFQNLVTTASAINFQYASTISNNTLQDCSFNYSYPGGYGILEVNSMIGCYFNTKCNILFSSSQPALTLKYNRVFNTIDTRIFDFSGNSYTVVGNQATNGGKGSFLVCSGSNATTGNTFLFNTINQADVAFQSFILITGTSVRVAYNTITLTGNSVLSSDNYTYVITGTSCPTPIVYNNTIDVAARRIYALIHFNTGGAVCGAITVYNNKLYVRTAVDNNPIEIGGENDVNYTGKNDGTTVYNNYILMPLFYGGTWGNSHGVFISGGSANVYGNFIYGGGIGFIQKAVGGTFTTVFHHNVAVNCRISFYSKAVVGCKFFNNTIETATTSTDSPAAFDIVKNGTSISSANEIKNNLIICKAPAGNFFVYSCDSAAIFTTLSADYNQVYALNSVAYSAGAAKTWSQWKTLGKDAHSTWGDITFTSKNDYKYWPTSAITGATSVSTTSGININTKFGDTLLITSQGATWQRGAYIVDGTLETVATDKEVQYTPSRGEVAIWNLTASYGNPALSYTPIAHQTTEDAINGIVKVNGAGWYSAASANTDFLPVNSPTMTGTVTIPTPFKIGTVSVTSTGTQLNYLSGATGTTGTTSTNLVYSTSPQLTTPNLGKATATKMGIDSTASCGQKDYGNTGTAINFYLSQGNTQTATRTGNCTVTLVGAVKGTTYTLIFKHEASPTAYTLGFSPTVLWSGGTAPTWTNTSNARDMMWLKYDGTVYYGGQLPDFK